MQPTKKDLADFILGSWKSGAFKLEFGADSLVYSSDGILIWSGVYQIAGDSAIDFAYDSYQRKIAVLNDSTFTFVQKCENCPVELSVPVIDALRFTRLNVAASQIR